ncbi:MAG: hypothetical protein J6V09_05160 [Clostridia bacterium]|nr:hypothetical protein [Clostridia bacterium]
MSFDNLVVNHKSFGMGTIVSKQGKYITVKFENAQKTFVYPDVFDGFLTLADGSVPLEISCDLAKVKLEKQLILDKKIEENVRAMTKGIVIPGKEIINEVEDDDRGYNSQDSDKI